LCRECCRRCQHQPGNSRAPALWLVVINRITVACSWGCRLPQELKTQFSQAFKPLSDELLAEAVRTGVKHDNLLEKIQVGGEGVTMLLLSAVTNVCVKRCCIPTVIEVGAGSGKGWQLSPCQHTSAALPQQVHDLRNCDQSHH
jgi:hypothetical protein